LNQIAQCIWRFGRQARGHGLACPRGHAFAFDQVGPLGRLHRARPPVVAEARQHQAGNALGEQARQHQRGRRGEFGHHEIRARDAQAIEQVDHVAREHLQVHAEAGGRGRGVAVSAQVHADHLVRLAERMQPLVPEQPVLAEAVHQHDGRRVGLPGPGEVVDVESRWPPSRSDTVAGSNRDSCMSIRRDAGATDEFAIGPG
jgi:hypothetical protein